MTWTAVNVFDLLNLVDSARGDALYQRVRVSGAVWVNGMARGVGGGICVVEVYRR